MLLLERTYLTDQSGRTTDVLKPIHACISTGVVRIVYEPVYIGDIRLLKTTDSSDSPFPVIPDAEGMAFLCTAYKCHGVYPIPGLVGLAFGPTTVKLIHRCSDGETTLIPIKLPPVAVGFLEILDEY
jgi:hypothetical protein